MVSGHLWHPPGPPVRKDSWLWCHRATAKEHHLSQELSRAKPLCRTPSGCGVLPIFLHTSCLDATLRWRNGTKDLKWVAQGHKERELPRIPNPNPRPIVLDATKTYGPATRIFQPIQNKFGGETEA
ncbi:hypothetical protein Y1Q_0013671 [Alligator mississippiensis]|uniref:Uncharacterized protein n=1 Tax=Alligator mississippiensis TaxID=8496 RepID=A0A151P3N1_ALLMI|nr:hypothetical protein Y1Q_0013671 [Alligator mississippiensis]